MLQLFRNFFRSKIGIVVTLAFLGLIAFAFASMDVANTGTFGGVAGGDRVAVVGDTRIDSSELSVRASDALNRIRQEDPTVTMEAFINEDGLNLTLENAISRISVAELGRMFGLRAGTRLVDSEIANDPNLRGLDGQFSADNFRAVLRQQGISEELYRSDRAMSLFTRQMVGPLELTQRIPEKVVRRYAEMRAETRDGSVTGIFARNYLPDEDPTQAQLEAFYAENSDNYMRPERRVLRYAIFTEDAFVDVAEPSSEQVAEYYEANRSEYGASETRSFTQLIATTQAAAQAIVDEVNGGTSLEASARSKGLSTSTIASTTRADLASTTSDAVAAAGFAAREGTLSAPARGDLGWYVLRADDVEVTAARTLEQARPEITAMLRAEMLRTALNEGIVNIEDEIARGSSLTELAEDLGIEVAATRPVTARGQVYGTQETAPQELAPVLPNAFEMEEGSPQLAELVPGESFIIYEASDITRAAVAPLAEITDDVTEAWRFEQGMKAAGEAADRIVARVAAGTSLAEAVRAEEVTVPQPDRLRLNRAEIDASGRQITRPVALFFSMAEGTIKPLEAEEMGGWFIIQLNDITTPELAEDSPAIASTREELLQLLPNEIMDQFVAHTRNEVEIEVNDVAVDALAAQLTGRN